MSEFDFKKYLAEGGIESKINESSPLYSDQGEITDTIYDYADRIKGAEVNDPYDLIDYYSSNPDEVPEPMDPEFFVAYAQEIKDAIEDEERFDVGDIDM
jgi:hypothetical protein